MKSIIEYITEKFKINSKISSKQYTCQPKNAEELRKIIFERLKNEDYPNLNDIDVSKITDMHDLFLTLPKFNGDISEWDVSNVKDMNSMFKGCKNFNSDLRNWDISNVKDMKYMFDGCDSLKNIPSWYKE